jgi:hypothetical protein
LLPKAAIAGFFEVVPWVLLTSIGVLKVAPPFVLAAKKYVWIRISIRRRR